VSVYHGKGKVAVVGARKEYAPHSAINDSRQIIFVSFSIDGLQSQYSRSQ